MSTHTKEALVRAYDKIAAAVAAAETADLANGPHIGRNNRKIGAIAEGTSPLVTCCAHARLTCGRECYAVWHIDNIYQAARRNHAENTILRRRDARAYYRAFFAAAVRDGVPLLRVNETGDFENERQVFALAAVAAEFPAIKVVGYTRRHDVAWRFSRLGLANVHIRYSLYRDAAETAPFGCKCAAVSDTRSSCPSQLFADQGKTWNCAMCAAKGVGCCGRSAVITFKAH